MPKLPQHVDPNRRRRSAVFRDDGDQRGQMRQLRGNNMDEAESALYEMEVDDPAGDLDADYDAIEEDRALDAAGLKDITYQEFMKRADTARRLSEEQDMSDRAAKSFGRRPDKEEM